MLDRFGCRLFPVVLPRLLDILQYCHYSVLLHHNFLLDVSHWWYVNIILFFFILQNIKFPEIGFK